MNIVLMTAVICGFLYLALVTWLFRKKSDGTGDDGQITPREDGLDKGQTSPVSVVPVSSFDMEAFQETIARSVAAAVTHVLTAQIGDVDIKDVEFGDDGKAEDNATEEDDDVPDIGQIDPGAVSPPASGDSIEEIEAALNISANPQATAKERASAGKILSGMRDVVFIGKMMEADSRINDGIMKCIAESMRKDKKRKPTKRGNPAPKEKPKPIDVATTIRDMDLVKRKKDDDED